ncbi:rod shape-determining protein MreD [uncultured Bacteroides sp.]|uniref:rod shape-determining protein MreD n=1 Tax=uncultured Bacteroides sp. TaxID=162156 RepID=UPI002AA76618|nr:rod shape-determining protein MreD [uncultured Bacteroides sp.]
MIINYIHKVAWFFGLVLLQVVILNNLHIAGYAPPFFYIYFILKFDTSVSRNELMIWGFLIGLAVDVFSNTPGMNAASTVFLAFVRPLLLRLFMSRDNLDNISPSMRSMGTGAFVKFLIASLFIHHTMLLTIELFSFTSMLSLLLSIVFSMLLTFTFIMAVEGIKK